MDLHLAVERRGGPLGAQIADGLRDAIRSGRLAALTRLPPSRELARDLAVSRGIVVGAYEQLIAEGFLIARQGHGTRVAPLAAAEPSPGTTGRSGSAGRTGRAGRRSGSRTGYADEVPEGQRALQLADAASGGGVELPAGTFDLRPGKPDLASFPRGRWLAAVRHVFGTVPNSAFNYPDPGGVTVLRTELAGYLRRVRAAAANPESVVITAGVAQVLASVPRILAAEGHRLIAVEDPMGHHQLPVIRAAGVEVAGIPVDDEGIDVAALARTGARAVLVTPAHQYPTGVVLSPERRAALVAWAREVGGVIVEDDYDAEFRNDRDPVGCLQGLAPSHVILTGSVSKGLAPALRIGWAVAPLWLAHRLRATRALTDLGAPAIDQHALAHLIAAGAYDRHLRTMRRLYRGRREVLAGALADRLPEMRIRGVSAGLHLYAELPRGCDERAVIAAGARRGLALEGAAPMRVNLPGPPALVLGFGRLSEPRLAEAVALLAEAVRESPR